MDIDCVEHVNTQKFRPNMVLKLHYSFNKVKQNKVIYNNISNAQL